MDDIIIETNKFNTKYKIKLGEGSYGCVYKDDNKAIKIFKDDLNSFSDYDPSAIREIQTSIIMGNAGVSPKVDKIYCGNSIGFSMELCMASLYDVIHNESKGQGNLEEIDYEIILENIDYIIFQITYALAHAQQQKILHRDVKPQNIFIHKKIDELGYSVYLGDWGLSSVRINNHLCDNNRTVQTIWYRCPEHLLKINEYVNNETIDMWSVGIIILEILHRKQGLIGKNKKFDAIQEIVNILGMPEDEDMLNYLRNKRILEKLNKNNISQNYVKNTCSETNMSVFCEDFIMRCLEWSPTKRFTPIEALRDPFLCKFTIKIEIEKLKLLLNDDPFLKLLRLSSFDKINILEISKKNPHYINFKTNKFENSTRGIKESGRLKFLRFYDKLTRSLQLFSMCISYTDKMMELVYFDFDFDVNFGFAIYVLAYGALSDTTPDKNTIIQLKRQLEYSKIDDGSIVYNINFILRKFEYNLPIKTFVTYQELVSDNLNFLEIKELYRKCCEYLIFKIEIINLSTEQIFCKILEIIDCYQYEKNNHVIVFKNKIKYLDTIRKKYKSVFDIFANFDKSVFQYNQSIDYNDGIISLCKK